MGKLHYDNQVAKSLESETIHESSLENREYLSRPLHIEGPVSALRGARETSSTTSSTSRLGPRNHSGSEFSFVGTSIPCWALSLTMDEPVEDTLRIINDLATAIVLRCIAFSNHQDLTTYTPQPRGPSGSAQSPTAKEVLATRPSRSSKRLLQDHDEEDHVSENEDGDEDRVPNPKRKRGSLDRSIRLFACPFAKFDPGRYSEQNHEEKNYRKCSSKYLRNIARLKQHLYRTHKRPEWYCGNCYKSFDLREQLNEHNRERPPCERSDARYEEMMTDAHFKEIKRRNQGNSQYETWYKIFQLLFPNAQRPISPYVSTCDPDTVQHFVGIFQLIGPQELFRLLQDRRERGQEFVQLGASTKLSLMRRSKLRYPSI